MLANVVNCGVSIYRSHTSGYGRDVQKGTYRSWLNHWLPVLPLRANGYKFHYIRRDVAEFLVREIFSSEEAYYAGPIDKTSPLIVDIGSNIGVSVHYFKHKYPSARIIGFEPAEEVYNVLLGNIMVNRLNESGGMVRVHNAAVSDHDGTTTFHYVPDNNGCSSLFNPVTGDRSIERTVKVVDINKVIVEPVDLLKVDAEGAERDIFNALFKSGKIDLVDRVIMEYHYAFLGDKPFKDIVSGLVDHGFSVRPRTVDVNAFRNWLPFDMIYARKEGLQ